MSSRTLVLNSFFIFNTTMKCWPQCKLPLSLIPLDQSPIMALSLGNCLTYEQL